MNKLLLPLIFLLSLFCKISMHYILLLSGISLICSIFLPTHFKKILFFLILGLIRGHYNNNIPEEYSYKRTSFSATVSDIKHKEHGTYLLLENFEYQPAISEKQLDTTPTFPSQAQFKLANKQIEENIPLKKSRNQGIGQEKLAQIEEQLQPGTHVHAIGRFMLPTPGPIKEKQHSKTPSGIIDEIEIIQTKNNRYFKTFLRKKFEQNLSKRSAQFAKAILLGDTFAIDPKTRNTFQKSGLAHLLGVSVLNIAILSVIFYYLIRKFIGRFFYKLALSIPLNIIGQAGAIAITFIYCYLVGFEYPLLRSLLMSSFSLIALYFGRNRNKEVLLWSAAFILAVNPAASYDIGFQLSFGAVLGLCCAPNNKLIIRNNIKLAKIYNFFIKSVYSTFFASAVIIPVSLYQFHTTSIQPFIANIFAIPFVSFVITPLSFIASISSFINLEKIFMIPLDWAFIIFNWFANITSPIGINIHVDPINFIGPLLFIFSLILFASFKSKVKYIFLSTGIASFIGSIVMRNKAPMILVHPYAIGLILDNKIIAYPKCNFITNIWEQAYNRPCIPGKNTPYFIKEKCGKLIVANKIGLIFQTPKGTCDIKTKNYIIPYGQQMNELAQIKLQKNEIDIIEIERNIKQEKNEQELNKP